MFCYYPRGINPPEMRTIFKHASELDRGDGTRKAETSHMYVASHGGNIFEYNSFCLAVCQLWAKTNTYRH